LDVENLKMGSLLLRCTGSLTGIRMLQLVQRWDGMGLDAMGWGLHWMG